MLNVGGGGEKKEGDFTPSTLPSSFFRMSAWGWTKAPGGLSSLGAGGGKRGARNDFLGGPGGPSFSGGGGGPDCGKGGEVPFGRGVVVFLGSREGGRGAEIVVQIFGCIGKRGTDQKALLQCGGNKKNFCLGGGGFFFFVCGWKSS